MLISSLALSFVCLHGPKTFLSKPLDNDFVIATATELGSTYENSSGTTIANRRGVNAIIVAAGQAKKLIRLSATIDGVRNGGAGSVSSLPALGGLYPVVDNNVVRTENGGVLAQWDGAIDENYIPAPNWWQTHRMTFFYNKVGMKMRGSLIFVKSDINGVDWTRSKPFDLLDIEDGKYAKPRPYGDNEKADIPGQLNDWKLQGKYSDGSAKWFPSGCDRTEIYACPFTGNLYATTRVISGPMSKTDSQVNTMLLLGSTNQGQSWTYITNLPGWSPGVMTSTSDGRLWIMQTIGNTDGETSYNSLTYTEPLGRLKLPSTFKQTKPAFSSMKGSGPTSVDMEYKVSQISICRVMSDPSGPAVLVSYPIRNGVGMQEYRIVKVTISSSGITNTNVGEIQADKSGTHSVMLGTFIQPELVGEPTSKYTDTSLFYWYDARRVTSTGDGGYSVRYRVFRGGKGAETGYLSMSNGAPRTWKVRHDPGDYMKGASFVSSDQRVAFIPQWSESNGIHGQFLVTK